MGHNEGTNLAFSHESDSIYGKIWIWVKKNKNMQTHILIKYLTQKRKEDNTSNKWCDVKYS